MFEFLITVFACSDASVQASCKPIGQRTAIYASPDDCGRGEFELIAESLLEQGLKPEDVDKQLEPIRVICQQGPRVTQV